MPLKMTLSTSPTPHKTATATATKAFYALATATLLMVSHGSAVAQAVYRIVGPDGKVTFSDRPPPAGTAAKSNQDTRAEAAASPAGNGNVLPYELRQVAQRFPVTLYTRKDCAPCNSARNLLNSRGIPYAERTVETSEDADALQRISNDNSLPFGTIGSQQLKGYSDVEWTDYLNAAGYPKTSQLPANYRRPAPAPLVAAKPLNPPADAPAAQPSAQPPAPAEPSVAPPVTNPAGIRF